MVQGADGGCRVGRQWGTADQEQAAGHVHFAVHLKRLHRRSAQAQTTGGSQPPGGATAVAGAACAGRGCTLCVRKWRLAAPFAQSLLGSLQAQRDSLEVGEIGIGFQGECSKGMGQGR